MGFIMEMKMDKLMGNIMGNKFGKRFDYNELIMDNEWWVRLTTLEQTLNYNGIQNNLILITKNEFNI